MFAIMQMNLDQITVQIPRPCVITCVKHLL